MKAAIVRWWVGVVYWIALGLAPAYAGGCGSFGAGIEAATEAARGVCRAIARDWAPELVVMIGRLVTLAESQCACPPEDGSGSGQVSP